MTRVAAVLVVCGACWSRPAAPPVAHAVEPPRGDILRGDARILERSAGGGLLVLDGDRHQARARAEAIMEGHCAGKYEVTEDGPVAAEWRIQYICRR